MKGTGSYLGVSLKKISRRFLILRLIFSTFFKSLFKTVKVSYRWNKFYKINKSLIINSYLLPFFF